MDYITCCNVYLILETVLSKSRLRALNTQNQSISPVHINFNSKSLCVTWKMWFLLYQTLSVFSNQKSIFFYKRRFIHKYIHTISIRRSVELINSPLRKYKKILKVTSNKFNMTNIKVITQNSKLFIIFIKCPLNFILSRGSGRRKLFKFKAKVKPRYM